MTPQNLPNPASSLSSAGETTDDPSELFDRINERDEVIGRVARGEAHRDPTLLHRSVQVLIFGTDGRLLLQRRSAHKDLFPGYYCASASGHVMAGDDYERTAEREVAEELGIGTPLRFIGKTLVRSPMETEMTALFVATSDGPFHFHPTETDGGEFFTLAEVYAAYNAGSLPMTPALIAALDALRALPADAVPVQ